MARTRVRFGWATAAVVVLLVGWLALRGPAVQATGPSDPAPVPSPAGAEHVVRPGDTLWGIARDLVGPEGDPRPLVEDIREANGLGTSLLREGSALVLPSVR